MCKYMYRMEFVELENEAINNQAYLEICDNFKEVVEEKDTKIKKYINKYNNLYKDLFMVYGLLRLIDNHLNVEEFELNNLIERLRGILSDILFSDLEEVDYDLD